MVFNAVTVGKDSGNMYGFFFLGAGGKSKIESLIQSFHNRGGYLSPDFWHSWAMHLIRTGFKTVNFQTVFRATIVHNSYGTY